MVKYREIAKIISRLVIFYHGSLVIVNHRQNIENLWVKMVWFTQVLIVWKQLLGGHQKVLHPLCTLGQMEFWTQMYRCLWEGPVKKGHASMNTFQSMEQISRSFRPLVWNEKSTLDVQMWVARKMTQSADGISPPQIVCFGFSVKS